MKYLFITLLFTLSSTILTAQDTLYIKGERKPLIVEIETVKKKKIDYRDLDSGRLKTISLKKVRKVRFDKNLETISLDKTDNQEPIRGDKEEYRSTVLLQLSGIFNQTQAGANYMHRISPAFTETLSIWVQTGGGYHEQRTFRRNSKGYYLEFGGRLEWASRRKPENRFHLGLDINNQWSRGTESDIGFLLLSSNVDRVDDSRIALQIPIGYTFRSENGFYLSMGLEFSTRKFFPAYIFRSGYTFGK